jgi:hypothetical protein
MRAVLLCPGPSLARLTCVPDSELSIGVNRAATAFAVGVWACCDLPAIEQWHEQVIGSPTLVCGQEAWDNLRDRKITWRGETCFSASMASYCPPGMNWTMFSSTVALIHAAFRGATQIDVYGCDWAGTADFDGVQAGKNRSPDRWKLEREIWQNVLVPWLAARGVTITRHQPPVTE